MLENGLKLKEVIPWDISNPIWKPWLGFHINYLITGTFPNGGISTLCERSLAISPTFLYSNKCVWHLKWKFLLVFSPACKCFLICKGCVNVPGTQMTPIQFHGGNENCPNRLDDPIPSVKTPIHHVLSPIGYISCPYQWLVNIYIHSVLFPSAEHRCHHSDPPLKFWCELDTPFTRTRKMFQNE